MNMKDRLQEALVVLALRLTVGIALLGLLAVFFDIAYKGAGVLSWEFLTEPPRQGMMAGGIFPAIIGSVYLVGLSLAVSVPLGILSAIYLAEYAHHGRLTRAVDISIRNLAGTPSIVFGLFGLGLFVNFLGFRQSLLSGALTLACMSLPVTITTSREALLAVPNEFREAAYALGATKLQVVGKVVLPNALSGILTGIVLSSSRVIGETAPIMLTAAAYYAPSLPSSPFDRVMALPFHLFVMATQSPNPLKTAPIQYGTSLVLLLLAVGLNSVALLIRAKRRRLKAW
ncbi:MAG: phosphate ABC transporter permease PstA [Candidatus Bathyarchaeia archaeon]